MAKSEDAPDQRNSCIINILFYTIKVFHVSKSLIYYLHLVAGKLNIFPPVSFLAGLTNCASLRCLLARTVARLHCRYLPFYWLDLVLTRMVSGKLVSWDSQPAVEENKRTWRPRMRNRPADWRISSTTPPFSWVRNNSRYFCISTHFPSQEPWPSCPSLPSCSWFPLYWTQPSPPWCTSLWRGQSTAR